MSDNPCAVGALPEETVDALEAYYKAAGKFGQTVEVFSKSLVEAVQKIGPEFFYLMYLITNDYNQGLLSYDEWKLMYNWKDKDNEQH